MKLQSCYTMSVNALTEEASGTARGKAQCLEELCIAAPLLGAGARGAPAREAADVALTALTAMLRDALSAEEGAASAPSFVNGSVGHLRFRFVAQRSEIFEKICAAVERDVGGAAFDPYRDRVEAY